MKRYVIALLALLALVLSAYHALVYYDNNFRYGRMWETPAVRPLEEPVIPMPRGAAPQGWGEALFRGMAAEALDAPFGLDDPQRIEQGKALYFPFCAQCHGRNLDGNGTVGQSFHPLPADLRSLKVQSLSGGAIFRDISYGRPGGRQPPLAGTIDVEERWLIIAYIKSLGARK